MRWRAVVDNGGGGRAAIILPTVSADRRATMSLIQLVSRAPPLLVIYFQVLTVAALSSHPSHDYSALLESLRLTGPVFDRLTSTNVTAQVGSHAFLDCTVHHLMDKSVSWVRNRDSHILTVDRYTFIADARFQCFHPEDTDDWTLQIKYVQARDAGLYECQVSTEPKIWRTVQLNVVEPHVKIEGGSPDMFVNAGSTVAIRCIISQTVAAPTYTFWYHDGRRVTTTDGAGTRRWVQNQRTDTATSVSTLRMERAGRADSGNYTCAPHSLPSASVRLHVLNGEHHAAMQDGVSAGWPARRSPPLWTLCLTLPVVLDALAALMQWR